MQPGNAQAGDLLLHADIRDDCRDPGWSFLLARKLAHRWPVLWSLDTHPFFEVEPQAMQALVAALFAFRRIAVIADVAGLRFTILSYFVGMAGDTRETDDGRG